jgi:hypothetical protein
MFPFLEWGVVSTTPNNYLEDHPFSAVRHCLFNTFAATFYIWRKPEGRRAMAFWQGPTYNWHEAITENLKTGNARIMSHCGAFANHCYRGKAINITYLRVRACLRVVGCPGAWVCARVLHSLSSIQRVRAVLYRYLLPLWVHHIFRHYFINGTIFGKELLGVKCVFLFSL